MPEFTKATPGNFCWADANLEHPEKGRGFYCELFGWSAQDMSMPQGNYTMLTLGEEKRVAGILKLPDNAKKMGAPPHWLTYVCVEDSAQVVERAKALGGRVLLEPTWIGQGTMSVLQDPTGGVLATWSAPEPLGTSVMGEVNTVCWSELETNDVAVARQFYTELFGWTSEVMPMGAYEYTVVKNRGQSIGGIMQRPNGGTEPSAWQVYFAVDDTDAKARRATQLGAKMIVPPIDIPNIGRFAFLEDPEGAHFAVIKNSASSS
jgi:predicted enzyme related to lactoylglutathione lyase